MGDLGADLGRAIWDGRFGVAITLNRGALLGRSEKNLPPNSSYQVAATSLGPKHTIIIEYSRHIVCGPETQQRC